jgi:two-component SAPR family response regulator
MMEVPKKGDVPLAKRPLEGLKLLVLEDEVLIAMDVEQLCREHGASEVVTLRKVEELGTQPFDDFPHDAAVLDVRLADDSTIEFARQLMERGIPFVFATGYEASENLFEAFPGISVIPKPYESSALIRAIAESIARARISGGA